QENRPHTVIWALGTLSPEPFGPLGRVVGEMAIFRQLFPLLLLYWWRPAITASSFTARSRSGFENPCSIFCDAMCSSVLPQSLCLDLSEGDEEILEQHALRADHAGDFAKAAQHRIFCGPNSCRYTRYILLESRRKKGVLPEIGIG